jgi:hypothetical protein
MYKIKRFFEQIRNVFYYLPAIWKGFDFDHGYLEELMYLKMKKMIKRLTYDSEFIFIDEKKCVKSLRIALKILERRRTGWYLNLTSSYSSKLKFEYKEIEDIEDIEDNYSLHLTGLTPEEDRKYSESIAQAWRTEQRDWKIFCDIMSKYFNTWWS